MQIKQWINAIRPRCGMSAALLVISGFRNAHQPIDWSVVTTVFFLTSMAMLWNDYHDRDIDVAKGRLLAINHPIGFLRYTMVFVVISFGLSVFVWLRNPSFGMLCVGMWITSIAYSEAQCNPIAKNAIVSLNWGGNSNVSSTCEQKNTYTVVNGWFDSCNHEYKGILK